MDYPFGGSKVLSKDTLCQQVAILVLVDYPFGVYLWTNTEEDNSNFVAILVLVDYPFGEHSVLDSSISIK